MSAAHLPYRWRVDVMTNTDPSVHLQLFPAVDFQAADTVARSFVAAGYRAVVRRVPEQGVSS